jgi:hypothetical protein
VAIFHILYKCSFEWENHLSFIYHYKWILKWGILKYLKYLNLDHQKRSSCELLGSTLTSLFELLGSRAVSLMRSRKRSNFSAAPFFSASPGSWDFLGEKTWDRGFPFLWTPIAGWFVMENP